MTRTLAMTTTLALLLGVGAPLQATAEGPHDDAIEARQSMFRLYGYNFGVLSDMAKEKIEYDAERAAEAAANLDLLANLGQSGFWPEGSDNGTDGNAETRALPAIWERYPDILEKATALREAAAEAKGVAGDGLDALQGAVGDLGGTCKGCHDDYRAKKS